MFRLWAREFKDGRMLRDLVVEDDSDDTRTHKVFGAIEKACLKFDLSRPIWLEANVDEFKRTAVTRFRGESFIDEVDFDYLEVRIIEED